MLTGNGKILLGREFPEEALLKKLPININKLHDEEVDAFHSLRSRKDIVKSDLVRDVHVLLTELGNKLKNVKIQDNLIESLTHEMLLKGQWKNKKFRRYDIKADLSKIYYGRRHFTNEAISYIKRIWLDLGFKEMTGNLVQTGFWNFDALFTPQDHPAREIQDTFYIKDPEKGKLPNHKIVGNVRLAHEKGIKGSKGWNYSWKEEEAKRNVLRTHTTVLSAKTIASLKNEDLPAKFFSVGLGSWIGFQALFNIGAMIGILPLTGVPLPLISYGGSAMIATLSGLGLVLNVSRYQLSPKKK